MPARLITLAELRSTLALAIPVIAVEVGLMAMGTVDTMFVGRVSAQAVASVAIGHTYFWVTVILGIGILFAIDPLITQAVGAGDEPSIARAVQRGFVLAVALAGITALMLVPGEPVLRFLQQPAEVIPDAARFARASIAGVLPLYCFIVVRIMMQARNTVAPLVVAILAGNAVNIALNWLFVTNLRWGPEGSGWASSISRWAMFATLLAISWRDLRPYLRPWLPETLTIAPMRKASGMPRKTIQIRLMRIRISDHSAGCSRMKRVTIWNTPRLAATTIITHAAIMAPPVVQRSNLRKASFILAGRCAGLVWRNARKSTTCGRPGSRGTAYL